MRGIRALQQGLIWRVGDGEQIRILEDPWIPEDVTRRPRTPKGVVLLSRAAELVWGKTCPHLALKMRMVLQIDIHGSSLV